MRSVRPSGLRGGVAHKGTCWSLESGVPTAVPTTTAAAVSTTAAGKGLSDENAELFRPAERWWNSGGAAMRRIATTSSMNDRDWQLERPRPHVGQRPKVRWRGSQSWLSV
jgi:hypothetical protein